MSDRKYTVIDLFAGCGGLSLGLYLAGWSGIFAVEKNKCAFETLKYNLISKVNHFDWPEWLPVEPIDINALIKVHKKELKNYAERLTWLLVGRLVKGSQWRGNE